MINKMILICLLFSFIITKDNEINSSLNTFGIDLYKIINDDNESSMISPWSISNSLMMVSQGASNKTYIEILDVLNLDQQQLNYFINPYKSTDSTLLISNSIWIQNDKCYKPNNTYIDILEKKFTGKISYVNFYNDRIKIIDDINNWVNDFTNGSIKNITWDDILSCCSYG